MTDLWEQERRLWLEGAEAFEALLAPGAVMLFPGVGILRDAQIVEGLKAAPCWNSVEMTDRTEIEAEGSLTIAYRAEGRREGEPLYRALCSSTWIARPEGWRIALHQQTPEG